MIRPEEIPGKNSIRLCSRMRLLHLLPLSFATSTQNNNQLKKMNAEKNLASIHLNEKQKRKDGLMKRYTSHYRKIYCVDFKI